MAGACGEASEEKWTVLFPNAIASRILKLGMAFCLDFWRCILASELFLPIAKLLFRPDVDFGYPSKEDEIAKE